MDIMDILNRAFELKTADIFLVGGLPVTYKVNGKFVREGDRCDIKELADTIKQLYKVHNREFKPQEEKTDDDFSFSLPGLARFRCNVFYQRGSLSAVIRMLQFGIPKASSINIVPEAMDVANMSKGLCLVTGTVGSGKSTTIACIIDRINHEQSKNIITMEDPIEYLYQHDRCIISQREIPTDVPDFATAIRSSLRESPDILFVGEMRDPETISAAMTAAETGRLVISTLHTLSCTDTIDRIIDSYPPIQQNQIRYQLSRVLRCVICQQLVPGLNGQLYPAFEIMKATPAIQNLIREGKTYQIPSFIQTNRDKGMMTMRQCLDDLVYARLIDKKTANSYCEEVSIELK